MTTALTDADGVFSIVTVMPLAANHAVCILATGVMLIVVSAASAALGSAKSISETTLTEAAETVSLMSTALGNTLRSTARKPSALKVSTVPESTNSVLTRLATIMPGAAGGSAGDG